MRTVILMIFVAVVALLLWQAYVPGVAPGVNTPYEADGGTDLPDLSSETISTDIEPNKRPTLEAEPIDPTITVSDESENQEPLDVTMDQTEETPSSDAVASGSSEESEDSER